MNNDMTLEDQLKDILLHFKHDAVYPETYVTRPLILPEAVQAISDLISQERTKAVEEFADMVKKIYPGSKTIDRLLEEFLAQTRKGGEA